MVNSRAQLHLIASVHGDSVQPSDSKRSVVLQGDLSVVNVLDVIQLMCTQGHSWIITLLNQEADASLNICNGELTDARFGERSGQDALIELIALRRGHFQVRPHGNDSQQTIQGRWQQTLLAAVQRLDERLNTRRIESLRSAQAPAPNAAPRRESGESSSRVNDALELIDRGFAAIRAGNIGEARTHWAAALGLDPTNRALQFNLKKLEARESGLQSSLRRT